MTPERAEAVLRALLASLSGFIDEVEVLNDIHPGSAAHLLGTMRQCRYSLEQLVKRDEGRE